MALSVPEAKAALEQFLAKAASAAGAEIEDLARH